MSTQCIGQHGDQAPEANTGYLCHDCFKRLRSALIQLPAVSTWLEVNIAAGGPSNGERVAGTREDPIPLRLDVTDLVGPVAPNPTAALSEDMASGHVNSRGDRIIDQAGEPSLFDEMRSWASLVEEESGWIWQERRTLAGAVGYLSARLSWIVEQSWVDEFDAKVRDLTRRAHRVAPWREEIIRTADPCPSCNVRAVVLHVARSVMVCEKRMGGCGRSETSPYLKQATA